MIYYHVRAANGVTADWLRDKWKALSIGHREGLQVYRINAVSGRAVRIA